MEEPLDEKISAVRFYMNSLPDTLPVAAPEASVNALLSFSLDPAWVEDIGEEGAVNRALEVALFDFLPRNDAGIFRITSRGSAINILADEVNSEGPARRSTASVLSTSAPMQGNGVDRSNDASTVAPLASAWTT